LIQVSALAEIAKNQIAGQMSNLAESAKLQFNKYVVTPYIEKQNLDALLKQYPIRELYPRTGWHDCHASVAGLAARDIAAHFVQVII